MKVHHYTTIETLALILKNKTIRFNRLDKVDDLEESEYGISSADMKMGKYIFVSCWTKDNAENVALWGLYTRNKGVRITLDEDMFVTYPINETHKSYFRSFIEFGKDYVIVTANNNAEILDIEYVDNLAQKVQEIGDFSVTPDNEKYTLKFANTFGNFKSKHWKFQKECRFKIIALPCKYSKDEEFLGSLASNQSFLTTASYTLSEIFNSISSSFMEYQDISANYFDIPLNGTAFQNMEILLAPQSSEADKLIVEALIKSYCPTALLKESTLKGKIRGKL
ncbi:MAG: hypothetical protein BGO34_02190 [Bacteroidia bacterium 44-10]|nr:MAG: hypothetical protein BGO34_02190 [Bacteroidia bacterium 44-10]